MSERWYPARRSRGGDAAALAAGLLLFLALAAFVLGASREPGTAMLLLCSAAAILGMAGAVLMVLAVGYRRLTYGLTESALRIVWLGHTHVVPYTAIQGIYTGQRLSGHAAPGGLRWPGINVGQARVRGLGRLRFFATSTDQADLTLISVENGAVIVSASDPHEFQVALIARVERYGEVSPGATLIVKQIVPTSAPWTAVFDAWLPACVALGLLALLLVLASITLHFDALPDQVVLRFDANGQPGQIAAKSDLLRLPLLGLVCLAVNWVLGVVVHHRERVLARLLWLGGAIVQVVLLMGVLGISNRMA